MKLSIENIVKILQLKGVGRKMAFKICNSIDFSPTDNELVDIILDISKRQIFDRIPSYDRAEVLESFQKAEEIIDKSNQKNIEIISFYDSRYPSNLKEINDPPLIINVKGDSRLLNEKVGIAIIGTREPSDAGVKAGEYFAEVLGKMGFNIVSGLAKGCDASAHEGCLKGNGITTAILAHGLHTVYPKENKILAERIIENGGILLSEYLYGTGALSNYFVERDRLQSGLSKATIVVQTAEKGGTMHAVRATIKSRKKLAAVCYNNREMSHEKSLGNQALIRSGEAFALTSTNLHEFVDSFDNVSYLQPATLTVPESKLKVNPQFKLF